MSENHPSAVRRYRQFLQEMLAEDVLALTVLALVCLTGSAFMAGYLVGVVRPMATPTALMSARQVGNVGCSLQDPRLLGIELRRNVSEVGEDSRLVDWP